MRSILCNPSLVTVFLLNVLIVFIDTFQLKFENEIRFLDPIYELCKCYEGFLIKKWVLIALTLQMI